MPFVIPLHTPTSTGYWSNSYTFSNSITPAQGMYLTGAQFQCLAGYTVGVTVSLWSTSGTRLVTKTATVTTNGSPQEITFDSPYLMVSGTEYRLSVYIGGSNSSYHAAATGSYGSHTHSASGLSVSLSGTNYYSASDSWPSQYSTTIETVIWPVVQHPNAAPTKPTNLSPNQTFRDPRASFTFSWTHNDPDGNPQNAWEIRYREEGATTWVAMASAGGGTQSWSPSANDARFGLGYTYEWQVRTQDAGGLWSEWSDSALWVAGTSWWTYGTNYYTSTQSGNIPTTTLTRGKTYYWGVRTADAQGFGPASVKGPNGFRFTINSLPTTPGAFTVPSAGQAVDASLTASWGASTDAEGHPIRYEVEYTVNSTDSKPTWTNIVNASSAHTSNSLTINTSGWAETTVAKLRVRAVDVVDGVVQSAFSTWRESSLFTISHNSPPSAPGLWTSPSEGEVMLGTGVVQVAPATDAQADLLTYHFELLYNGVVQTSAQFEDFTGPINYDYSSLPNTTQAQWRARAWDGKAYGPYSTSPLFSVFNSRVKVKRTGGFSFAKSLLRVKKNGTFDELG